MHIYLYCEHSEQSAVYNEQNFSGVHSRKQPVECTDCCYSCDKVEGKV